MASQVTFLPASTVSVGSWVGFPGSGTNLHSYLTTDGISAGYLYDTLGKGTNTCIVRLDPAAAVPADLTYYTLVMTFNQMGLATMSRQLKITFRNTATNAVVHEVVESGLTMAYRTVYRVVPGPLPSFADLQIEIQANDGDNTAYFADRLNPLQVRYLALVASPSQLINPALGEAAPGGVAPQLWHHSASAYRAYANGKVLLRHPQMPVGMGSVHAYQLADNSAVSVERFQDHLVLGGTAPYLVYWNIDEVAPLAAVTEAAYLEAAAGVGGRGYWSGVEVYREDRNLVAPRFSVWVNDVDMSAYLYEFNGDSVTFVGPPSVVELLDDKLMFVTIKSGEAPIYSGILVRADSKAYANVRRVTVSMLTPGRYFDVDLSEMDTRESEALPASEATYLLDMLRASGFVGELYVDAGVDLRPLLFWTEPPPLGPGFELGEALSLYWNHSHGTSWQIIQTVAQANMLEVYEMPDGNLLLSPIVPYVDTTLPQLVLSAISDPENGNVRVYCDDGAGNFIADPRLDLDSISYALDESFAEIEVEAFSNTITSDIKVDKATFVQAGTQNRYLRTHLKAWTTDSNTATAAQGWPDTPWRFQRREGETTVNYGAPSKWFTEKKASRAPWSVIQGHQTPVEAGGSGVRYFTYLALHIDEPSVGFPGVPLADLQLSEADTDQRIAWAISGGATGGFWAWATWHLTADIPQIDVSTLRIEPNIGKFHSSFVPQWFPALESVILAQKAIKPRKARRVQNQLVAQIGSSLAVQVPAAVTALPGTPLYDEEASAAASHLATWLTCKEVMKSRQVVLRYAGAHSWSPNTFVSIARRPPAGPGTPVVWYDLLWVMDVPRVSGRVNGEVWTSVRCGYVGAYNVNTQEALYDMPISWGGPWDIR